MIVTLRTGVGFALLDRGVVYKGRHGFDGELGHTQIDPRGERCECGRQGCLETFVSPASMTRRVREKLSRGATNKSHPLHSLLVEGREVDPEELYRMSREGNPDCQEMVWDITRYLAVGIGNLINLFNPDSVVLCGAIENAHADLLKVLQEELSRQCLPQSWEGLTLRLSRHAEQTALLGAAVRAAQYYLQRVVQS